MFNSFKSGLLTLAAVAMLMPGVSAALTVSVSQPPDVIVVPGISFNDNRELPVFVPTVAARRNPLSVNLRGSVDLSLWNLVAAVHAQQRGDAFELVQASVASLPLPLSQPNVDPLSTVPLPPAVWLFVMGTLGLAGTRLTGLSGGVHKVDDATPTRDLSRNFGGALPA